MAKITGGHLIVRALRTYGIQRIFTIPGAPLFPIYEGCLDEGMEVVVGRHESGIVNIADGWSRATGKPSVVLAAPGPGHANAMGALSIAFAECSPVILLSGIDAASNLGKGGRQEIPQSGMSDAITKWSALLSDPKRIPEYISKAFRVATNRMPGPVSISITSDTIAALVDDEEVRIAPPDKTNCTSATLADTAFIEAALTLLSNAERPLIIAGGAAFWSHAEQPLLEFIEATNIPLMTVEHARGLVPDSHPLCFGDGYGTINVTAQLEDRADVIMLVGERIEYAFAFGKCFGSAKVIHICPDPNEIGRNHPVDLGVACDVNAILVQLLNAAGKRQWRVPEAWIETLRTTRNEQAAKVESMAAQKGNGVHPAFIAHEVEQFLNSNSILAFDGGDFCSWARYCMSARRPGGWLASTVLGHLGVGLPYAIGAKIGFPEAKVAVLTGDGALGFTVMEFETAVRHKVPVVVIVANDAAFGVEVYYQQKWFGPDRVIGTELTSTRWDLLVEAIGGHGEFVETPEQLRPALERAFSSGKPACINVTSIRTPSPQTLTFSRIYLLKRSKARKA